MSEKEINSRETFFVKKCLEGPGLNIWLNEVKRDTTSAKCKLCRTVFKLSAMSKSALMDHSDGKNIKSRKRKPFPC